MIELPDSEEVLDPQLSDFHSGLLNRATELESSIGGNHPLLVRAVSEYLNCLGRSIEQTMVVFLGMAGNDLVQLLEEYSGNDPDQADLLPEPKAALKSLVSLHLLFIRQFKEWTRFASTNTEHEIQEDQAGAVESSLEIAAEQTEDHPTVFSVETPRLIKGIQAMFATPGAATTTSLFWALRTLENLMLKIATTVVTAIETFGTDFMGHLSKKGAAVAAGAVLIAVGSHMVATLGALPAEWAWLKPFMDYVLQKLPEVAKALK